jgi:hypothetical protein
MGHENTKKNNDNKQNPVGERNDKKGIYRKAA